MLSILLNGDALAGIVKPARASVSISIDTLMNAEARAGFAMPARASTFNSIDCTNSLGGSGGPPDYIIIII